MEQEANPWKTIQISTPYENDWIRVEHHDVIKPNGEPGIYGKVHFKNQAIAVLPIDAEGNTYLVGQFRYTINAYSWELPEGGCQDESPLDAAKRELKEETGLMASQWTLLGENYLSNSVTDEKAMMFLATNLQFTEAEPEDTEQLQIKKIPVQEAIQMALNGEIKDVLSITTLLTYALKVPGLHLL
jgi:8-oxo-dGTP pyrophosphatase MutT (NUDIX family)